MGYGIIPFPTIIPVVILDVKAGCDVIYVIDVPFGISETRCGQVVLPRWLYDLIFRCIIEPRNGQHGYDYVKALARDLTIYQKLCAYLYDATTKRLVGKDGSLVATSETSEKVIHE
jgi:hypothetical protein